METLFGLRIGEDLGLEYVSLWESSQESPRARGRRDSYVGRGSYRELQAGPPCTGTECDPHTMQQTPGTRRLLGHCHLDTVSLKSVSPPIYKCIPQVINWTTA